MMIAKLTPQAYTSMCLRRIDKQAKARLGAAVRLSYGMRPRHAV